MGHQYKTWLKVIESHFSEFSENFFSEKFLKILTIVESLCSLFWSRERQKIYSLSWSKQRRFLHVFLYDAWSKKIIHTNFRNRKLRRGCKKFFCFVELPTEEQIFFGVKTTGRCLREMIEIWSECRMSEAKKRYKIKSKNYWTINYKRNLRLPPRGHRVERGRKVLIVWPITASST